VRFVAAVVVVVVVVLGVCLTSSWSRHRLVGLRAVATAAEVERWDVVADVA
jgi:hypothetical protein